VTIVKQAGVVFLLAFLSGCGNDSESAPPTDVDGGACGAVDSSALASGSDLGHADPFGAKAAAEARAGKLTGALMPRVKRPSDARNRIKEGDYVLTNDKIIAVIETARESDAYNTFGGEIGILEPVAEDGGFTGISQYGETLIAFSRQTVAPTSVTVVADGSDGKAAIVRASGVLKNIPFLDAFQALYKAEYNIPVAFDYVLEPHSEALSVRISLVNTTPEAITFGTNQLVGFFQTNRANMFTEKTGFGAAAGDTSWVGFDGNTTSFGFRMKASVLNFGLDISGFQYFGGKGAAVEACAATTLDYAELFTAAGNLDALQTVKRRIDGDTSFREVNGTLKEADGAPIANAEVHATLENGAYITYARTDAAGNFAMHLPASPALLTAIAKGYEVPAAVRVEPSATAAPLVLPTHATLTIKVTDTADASAIPARVQVIPVKKPVAPPASFGVISELDGRLHQALTMGEEIRLPVPAGDHRVIVSHGFEWSLFDATVTTTSGTETPIDAALSHVVDSTGVMCADFHVHSNYSVDSTDPPLLKVKSAIADGLELPISSDHEWVYNFAPLIEENGLAKWAFSFPSEELSTFSFGHFGIIPKYPDPNAVNVGALPWIGKTPQEMFAIANALPEKPVVIVNHPRSGGTFGAYFSSSVFNPETATGNSLYDEGFGALEAMNDSDFESNRDATVNDWFALLNAGKSVWAVGNSDSHKVYSGPVGYPRNCLSLGTDDPSSLTPELVRDVLRSGANVVTGGLFLTVKSPTGTGPGSMSTQGNYSVVVQAVPWLNADTLEVIVDGESVQTISLTPTQTSPTKRYEQTIAVAPKSSRARHWVVFHAKGPGDLAPLHPGRKAFAVSNPIFFP